MARSDPGDPDIPSPLGQVIVSQEFGKDVIGPQRFGMEKGLPPGTSPQRHALMVDSRYT